jgi:heat shock protein beta
MDRFYGKYATSLKLGVIQDTANRERLSKILRYPSAKNVDGKKITFEDYVGGMKKGQEALFFTFSLILSIESKAFGVR